MAEKNKGFTHYQQTLFNKYEVDESYLQTRRQRRACLELLEKVDKNQITDEKKLIEKIAAAFEGTRLYKRIASCVTIAALLVTLQGAPAMASAAIYRGEATAVGTMIAKTSNSVEMDEDSFLAGYVQKPQEARMVAAQPVNRSEEAFGIPASNSVLPDDDSDTFKSFSLANTENTTGSESVTITFEDHDKILYNGGYWGYPAMYDAGGYTLMINGMYYGVTFESTNTQPADTVVKSVGGNVFHSIFFYDYELFDIDSVTITNNSEDSMLFKFNSYAYRSYYGDLLCEYEIAPGDEQTIDFTSIDKADKIGGLGIETDWYPHVISIDDIKVSNITPITPVVSDNTKYGAEDTVMNFTVSDFVYNSIIDEPLSGIQIVIPPDPLHGVLKVNDTELKADDMVTAADLDKMIFTPASGFAGSTSFTYVGYDRTGSSKKPATMTLIIAPPNTPPVAADNNTWTTDENRSIQNGDLKGDVTDPDAGDTFTYERVTNAAYGNVIVNPDGTFTYTPNTNFYGTDSFTWRVSDGAAWSNTATVMITVLKIDTPTPTPTPTYEPEPEPTPKPTPVPTPVPTPAPTGGTVVVNGTEKVAGTETVSTENGVNTVELVVDSEIVEEMINQAVASGQGPEAGEQPENTVELTVKATNVDRITASLTGRTLQSLNDNDFALYLNTDEVDYLIPADGIRMDGIAEALELAKESPENVSINIVIEKVDDETLEEITAQAGLDGYEILFPPVRFTVRARVKDADGTEKEANISNFARYVERTIRIPEGVDPAKITTGVVYNDDGTFSHVPTEIFEKDGVYYARISSITNSKYLVIYNPVMVHSVENHWSRDIVNDLASRLVIARPESFMPDEEITRGEFAEYIARAIGIFRTQSGETPYFTDVGPDHEFADAITFAANYGIINGFTDGTFRPELRISREEAMTMVARTMDVIGLTETEDDMLETYIDADRVAQWAYESVKKVVNAGIFVGNTENTLDPKGTFTCAQAASSIRKLLIAAGLINQ